MNKKLIILLVLGLVVLLTIGFVVGIMSSENSENNEQNNSSSNNTSSNNTSTYTPIFVGTYLPIFVVIMSLQTPQYPVTQTIYTLARRKQSEEKKKKVIEQFISSEFKNSEKYNELFNLDFVKVKKATVKNEKSDNPIVNILLKDFSEYTFSVTKRDKKIDPKGSTKWVILDYEEQPE